MGIRIVREAGDRTPGYKVAASNTIYGGLAVQLTANDTVAVGGAEVVGLALESNVAFPAQASTPDNTVGDQFNYLDYNRGGLIAVVNGSAEVELYDDGRAAAGASHPVTYGDSWALMAPVYADATTGKLTTTAEGNKRIGRVTGITGTGAALVLRVMLEL